MREFIAETETFPKIRAWLYPEDPDDDIQDPRVFRPGGWRIVIERIEDTGDTELLRSTWEELLPHAIRHTDKYWTTFPVWRDYATGEIVTAFNE